jgi:hypothetical protein
MNMNRICCYLAVLLMQPVWASARDDLMTSQIVDEARTWQQKGRDDLAADAWHRLLVTTPQHGEALVSLGLIMAKSGDMAQAKALYARASRAKVLSAAMSKLASAVGDSGNDQPVSAVYANKSAAPKNKNPKTGKSSEKILVKPIFSPPPAKQESVRPILAAEPAAATVKVTPLPPPQIDTKVEPKLASDTTQEPSSSPKTPSPKPRPVKPLPYFSDL